MLEEINPLLTLCVAASILEEHDASTSQKRSDTSEETRGKSNEAEMVLKFEETYQAEVKFANNIRCKPFVGNIQYKPFAPKIPNNLIADYVENTSDELRKRFSYKCRFSPNICSEVVESYGNEVKAFSEIKQHIWNDHILGDSKANSTDRKLVTSSVNKSLRPLHKTAKLLSKFSKKSYTGRNGKTFSKGRSNRGKSFLQELSEMEDDYVLLDSHFEVGGKNFNDYSDTLKCGQMEHDYAKSKVKPSANPVHETVENRSPQGKFYVAYNKWLLCELEKHMNSDSYLMPPIIPTAPFPFVHEPEAPEPALVVELHSNGDPVDVIESVSIQPSISRISSKRVLDNKACRKKSRFARIINGSRSVLECVENRVTCKLSASSEQRDAPVSDISIENSENVEKSINEIAWRNIQILTQQRKKRKYRDKPSVYICEICNKNFTANTSLTYHYLGHLKIKPFKCHICCRTFTRRHSLKYHMMIHANKNRFQCSTCKRLFRHPSHYKEHLRKHTGEEPYSCKFCSNKFKTRNSFKRHLKIQHQKLLTSNGIVPIHDDN